MDFRSNKVYDFVSVEKNLKEAARKNEKVRIQWFERFGWILEEYKSMQQELLNICDEKRAASDVVSIKKDERSILPIPETTNGEYGWLAAKPEFCLENPHDYIIKHPNPMREMTKLKSNIPSLSPRLPFL